MPYPARLLHEDEEVLADVRRHWQVLAGPVAVTLVVLAGSVAAAVEGVPAAARWVVLVVLVSALIWLVGRYLRWAVTSLVVTSERVIHRRGVLARSGREIPLWAVTEVSYRQTVLGRLLRAGDLFIETAGRDGQEVLTCLPRPGRLHRDLCRAMDAHRRASWGGPALSIPDQIDKLADLRRRGVVTEEEFSAKKASLLNQL